MKHQLRFSPAQIALLLAVALLGACTSSTVRTTSATPINYADPNVAESLLLDVAVQLFDPGLEHLADNDLATVPEIRQAEARYMPTELVKTMQYSGHWGAVRVVPDEITSTDVLVRGEILRSDGELLELSITVSDSTGKEWFTKEYSGLASKFSYETKLGPEPFQDVYNRIGNDIAKHCRQLGETRVEKIRLVSELRFAESFSPEAFAGTLEQDKKGRYAVQRLPSDTDPMMQRIRQIRERDHLFVDTLQDYYGGFAREMAGAYQEWRRQSYEEAIAYRELRRQAAWRTVAGVASVAAGIAAAGSNNGSSRAAGNVAIIGGGYLIKSGFDKRAESQIHAEALAELGGSMGAEITPQVIELEDQTITLTGTVEDQYDQWRGLLRGIYSKETGEI